MKRDRATAILKRICSQIDRGDVPVPVTGLWVFGSYARGALEPGDIDLLLVHEPLVSAGGLGQWYLDARKRVVKLRSTLRRPGEAVEIFMGTSMDDALSTRTALALADVERTLLWSRADRSWEEKVAAIKPDPSAGSFEHGLFMKPKLAGCSLNDMEFLTRILRERVLAVEHVKLDENFCRRRDWPEDGELALEMGSARAGRARLVCLPYAIQWMLDRKSKRIHAYDLDLRSDDNRIRVSIGPLKPVRLLDWFVRFADLERAGHILHFRRGAARELLAFRRGKRWKSR